MIRMEAQFMLLTNPDEDSSHNDVKCWQLSCLKWFCFKLVPLDRENTQSRVPFEAKRQLTQFSFNELINIINVTFVSDHCPSASYVTPRDLVTRTDLVVVEGVCGVCVVDSWFTASPGLSQTD